MPTFACGRCHRALPDGTYQCSHCGYWSLPLKDESSLTLSERLQISFAGVVAEVCQCTNCETVFHHGTTEKPRPSPEGNPCPSCGSLDRRIRRASWIPTLKWFSPWTWNSGYWQFWDTDS